MRGGRGGPGRTRNAARTGPHALHLSASHVQSEEFNYVRSMHERLHLARAGKKVRTAKQTNLDSAVSAAPTLVWGKPPPTKRVPKPNAKETQGDRRRGGPFSASGWEEVAPNPYLRSRKRKKDSALDCG